MVSSTEPFAFVAIIPRSGEFLVCNRRRLFVGLRTGGLGTGVEGGNDGGFLGLVAGFCTAGISTVLATGGGDVGGAGAVSGAGGDAM